MSKNLSTWFMNEPERILDIKFWAEDANIAQLRRLSVLNSTENKTIRPR